MDRLASMALFCRIVEAGSLAAAARAEGLAGPTVVRALQELEERLGVRLADRNTRGLRLTTAGEDYLNHCRMVLRLTREADQVAQRHAAVPTGRMHVTAPRVFGRLHVAPVVFRLMQRHPGLNVELTLDDRVLDLLNNDVDAAVRIGHLPDSSLRASPLGSTRAVLCAAPAYLSRHGAPDTLQALAGHARVVFATHGSGHGNGTARIEGEDAACAGAAVFTSNSVESVVDAALAGIGIAQVYAYQVSAELASGRLCEVLPTAAPQPVPIQMVCAQARLHSAKLRVLRDALARAVAVAPGCAP